MQYLGLFSSSLLLYRQAKVCKLPGVGERQKSLPPPFFQSCNIKKCEVAMIFVKSRQIVAFLHVKNLQKVGPPYHETLAVQF